MVKNLKLLAASLAVIAIVATFSVVIVTDNFSSIEVQKTIPSAEAQVPVDAMSAITNQIVTHLTTTTIAPDVQRENINQAESLIFGKPVILQTNGVPDTILISADYDVMVTTINTALTSCADGTCSDSLVAAQAKELLDRNQYWQEIKANLEVQTTDIACDVNAPNTCVLLDQGDEPQATGPGINVGIDKIWNGWYRDVRSPYAPLTFYPNGFTQEENVIVPGPIANGECTTIVKEIQGLKSILRPVKIPIWQEPWTSRASIIGFNTVWVVDFVPVEFVKNLNYCNAGGVVTFDYDTNVIIERELLHLWKYLPAGRP